MVRVGDVTMNNVKVTILQSMNFVKLLISTVTA